MIQNLKNFKVDSVIRKKNKYLCIGTDMERPAILELSELPNTSFDTKDIFTRDHKILGNNDIYFTGEVDIKMNFLSHYKCPATSEDIQSIGQLYSYKIESYEEYTIKRKQFVPGILDKIIEHVIVNSSKTGDIMVVSEHIKSKLLYDGPEFLIIEELNYDSSGVLKLKLIYKNSNLFTIRDVSDPNILLRAKEEMLKIFAERGINENSICLYISLMPQDKRLHINATDISRQICISFEGGIVLIDNCIKNLNITKDYYKLSYEFIETEY